MCDITPNLSKDNNTGYNYLFIKQISYPGDSFSATFTSLSPGQKYYIRAYARNKYGTGYGNIDSFITGGPFALLTTSPITNNTRFDAYSGGSIIDDGGSPITSRGVCWSYVSTSSDSLPSINHCDEITHDGSGTGTFVSHLTSFTNTVGLNICVRSYATNANGTFYGNPIIFYPGSPYTLRQSFGGGIICFIDSTGLHGLIVANSDQVSSPVEWGCFGSTITGASSNNIGDGKAETDAISIGCASPGIAAKICKNLSLNGFNDWYLPNQGEQSRIGRNVALFGLGNFITTLGSDLSFYWSSYQVDANNANCITFSSSIQFGSRAKNNLANVRACRWF